MNSFVETEMALVKLEHDLQELEDLQFRIMWPIFLAFLSDF